MEAIAMKLIFVHGSGGCKESFRYQVEHFDGSEAVDLPGHPEGELCPTIPEYVEWLRAYIVERDYRDVVVVGHSLGGGIALQQALSYPEELRAIITIGSGARLRVLPMILETLEKAIQNPDLFQQFLEEGSSQLDPELTEVLRRRSYENGPAVSLNDLRACDSFDIMDRIGQISVPTLAICGTEDVMTPPKYSQYLTANIPGAQVVIIPGGTHMVYAEKPVEVNRAIDEFLRTIET
jgi:pimeloyl-ACP methyl ester carboxylesterase